MKKYFISMAILILPLIFGDKSSAQDVASKLSMLEIVISNLVSRVEALEKRVSELEGKRPAELSEKPKKTAPVEKAFVPPVGTGFEEVGKGFFVRNVRFNPFGSNVLLTGEMANKTNKNYRFAKFTLELYDGRDMLYKTVDFTIPDLPKGSTKRFESMLAGVEASLISRYVIKVANSN